MRVCMLGMSLDVLGMHFHEFWPSCQRYQQLLHINTILQPISAMFEYKFKHVHSVPASYQLMDMGVASWVAWPNTNTAPYSRKSRWFALHETEHPLILGEHDRILTDSDTFSVLEYYIPPIMDWKDMFSFGTRIWLILVTRDLLFPHWEDPFALQKDYNMLYIYIYIYIYMCVVISGSNMLLDIEHIRLLFLV